MRVSAVITLALTGQLFTLGGCSAPSSGSVPTNLPTVTDTAYADRDTESGLFFVVDSTYFGVLVYRQSGRNQKPLRSIQQDLLSPDAVWVDTQENLWVANGGSQSSGNKATIVRFPQRGTRPPDLILDDFGRFPTALWVSSSGAVYVVNDPLSAKEPAQIVEYPAHAKTYKVIGDPNISHYTTAVVGDAKGDLFAAGLTGSGVGEIDERHAGSTDWDDTGIAGRHRSVSQPWDLAFDAHGDLVVDDYGSKRIETFPPGQTKPSNTIRCVPMDCSVVAFDRSGSRLWVGEPNYDTGTVDEFEYPSGTLIESLTQPYGSSPVSLATSPDLYP
jgi:DNA-binding beta-propeller fold protein YncE